VATRRGCTTWKGGIGLATRLEGSGHMTERGQQHTAPSRASSRVSSTSCLVGLAAERYASEATRWPSVVAHEQLPSGLVAFAPPQACLCAEHVPRSSPASTSSPAWLAGLASSCTSDCRAGLAILRVDASSPLCRPHAAGAFFPLRRHAVAHRHASLLCVGCAQGSRLGREKSGMRKRTD
jgi:hypothetical protein